MEKYGNVEPIASNIKIVNDIINYDVTYWGKTETRQIYLNQDKTEKEG